MNKKVRNTILLLLTAVIWGSSFVAQSTGGDAIGPFAFNCIRSFIGALVLIPVMLFFDKLGNEKKPVSKEQKRLTLKAGMICGVVLFFASNLQQFGITSGTDSGKAGFITAFYILVVPILSLFLKRKSGLNVWISVAIAIVAMYFLCITKDFTIVGSDVYVFLCTFMFAVHILVIDKYSPLCDGVRISCIQFATCGALGIIPTLIFDISGFSGIGTWASTLGTWGAWSALLYSGVMSCGVAYTLQIIGQDGLNPTVASLLMSLESVFAVISGWLILHEVLSPREALGCVLMMSAVVLSQLDFKEVANSLKMNKQ